MIGAVLDCELSHIPRAPHTHTHARTQTRTVLAVFSLAHKWIEGRKREERRANREQIAEPAAFH